MMTGTEEMKRNMDNATKQILEMIEKNMDIARLEMENTAKSQAPWTDRTGNARNSITGSGVEKENETLRIGLAIGVEYGKYLELCNFGKYRIVWPTIEWESNKLLSRFKI